LPFLGFFFIFSASSVFFTYKSVVMVRSNFSFAFGPSINSFFIAKAYPNKELIA